MTSIQNQVAPLLPTASSFAPKMQDGPSGASDFLAFMSQETVQDPELILDAPHPELTEVQEIDLSEISPPPLPAPVSPHQVIEGVHTSVSDLLSIDRKPPPIASDRTPLESMVENANPASSAALLAPDPIGNTRHAAIDGAWQTDSHQEASQAPSPQGLDTKIEPARPQAVTVQQGLEPALPTTVTTSQVQPPKPLIENHVAHKIDAQQPTSLPVLPAIPAVSQPQGNVATIDVPSNIGALPVNQSVPNRLETAPESTNPKAATNVSKLPDGIIVEARLPTLEASSASWTQPSPATDIGIGSHRSAVLFGSTFFANSPQVQTPAPLDTTFNLQEMSPSPTPKSDWFAATARVTPTLSSPPDKASTTLGNTATSEPQIALPTSLPFLNQPVALPFGPPPQSVTSQPPVPLPGLAAQIENHFAPGKPTSVELALAPEELGKIRLVLTPEGDKLRVVIHAERPETIELLRRNTESFTAELRQSGFNNTSFSFGSWGDSPRGHPPQPNSAAIHRFTELTPPPLSIPEPIKVSGRTGLDLRV